MAVRPLLLQLEDRGIRLFLAADPAEKAKHGLTESSIVTTPWFHHDN